MILRIAVLASVIFSLRPPDGYCANVSDSSYSVAELQELPENALRSLLRASIEQRIDALRNIDVTSETRIYNCEFRDDIIGNRIADSGWFKFQMKRLDGSYRIDSKWFLTQESTTPEADSQANFIDRDAVAVFVGSNVAIPTTFARIDVKHASIVTQNPIAYWLGGTFGVEDDFLFASLLKAFEHWDLRFDADNDAVVVSHPYQPAYRSTPVGIRKVSCQISKGLLPVKVQIDFRDDTLAPGFWRTEEILIESADRISGVWIPSKIRGLLRTSLLGDNACALELTEVKAVSLGQVTMSQLQIDFLPGTKVADVIKGVRYTIGQDGRPVGPIDGLKSAAALSAAKPADRVRGVSLTLTGLLVLLLCTLVLRKWYKHRIVSG